MNTPLPKTIWFLWLQGIDNAPPVVKRCHETWVRHNPGWNIILLDEGNIAEHINIRPRQVSKQAFSDILRISLLAKHGGVWVDATCFCMQPLDDWLPRYFTTGFFAFNRPAPDRMISSWFIAAGKYNFIANAYQKTVEAYWDDNPALKPVKSWVTRFFNDYLQNQDTQLWFSALATKVLKVYPYFWFHFLFEHLYKRDINFKEVWDDTPKFSAEMPNRFKLTASLFEPLNADLKTEIDNKIAPLYKLTWKFELGMDKPGTVMDYFLNIVEDNSTSGSNERS